MKGHKVHGSMEHEPATHHRRKRKSGGKLVGEFDKDPSPTETYAGKGSNVEKEAKERKRGGKLMGKVDGEHAKHHAGRKPRKSGGRTGSNMNPLSSAHAGSPPTGRSVSANKE